MATKSKAKKTTAKKTNGTKSALRKEGKMARVRALMARSSGATREQILELTDWKAVSPQQIAEKAGLKIKLEKIAGQPTVYRTV
jgi:hypothetical protein